MQTRIQLQLAKAATEKAALLFPTVGLLYWQPLQAICQRL